MILFLNVQGLGKVAEIFWVRDLCNKNRVDLLSLQEIKMNCIYVFVARSVWGNVFVIYLAVSSARGLSGVVFFVGEISLCL